MPVVRQSYGTGLEVVPFWEAGGAARRGPVAGLGCRVVTCDLQQVRAHRVEAPLADDDVQELVLGTRLGRLLLGSGVVLGNHHNDLSFLVRGPGWAPLVGRSELARSSRHPVPYNFFAYLR